MNLTRMYIRTQRALLPLRGLPCRLPRQRPLKCHKETLLTTCRSMTRIYLSDQ